MTSKEWIELFFSKAFEKQINDLILEDIDYEIPRESILNYVHHVIEVPYKDYLDYVSNLELVPYDKFDIPYFDKYRYCESVLINYLISQDNIGFTEEEIGKYLADREWGIRRSTTFYGSIHLYSAKMLGIVYEYYNHWYLNCIGYVYETLSNSQRTSLLARTLLRSPFFRNLFHSLKTLIIYLENYMNMFSDRFVKMHLKSIMYFSEICVKEAHTCNILLNVRSTSKKYRNIGEYLNVDSLIPINASKSLRMYFKELKTFPIINEFEIRRLLKEYRNGNDNSLSLIVMASQLTVIKTALSFKYAPLEDIIQEGNIGVMNAIKNYDFERGSSYYGYLSFWVKRIIQSFSFSYPYMIHIPSNKLALLESFEKRVEKLLQSNEFMPPSEMFHFDNFSEKERDNLYDLLCVIDSMVKPLEEEKLYADIQYSPDYNLCIESLKYRLNHYLYFLSKRERDIIMSYFNLYGKGELTFSDIGNRYNMTRERIRQIFELGMRRLRILHNFCYVPSHLTSNDREHVLKRFEAKRAETESQNFINNRTGIENILVTKSKKKSPKSNKKNESSTTSQNTTENQTLHTLLEPEKKAAEKTVPSPNTLLNMVKVGDRILYDSKPCVVMEKRTKYGFTRLILKYDNGTYDNVPDNTDRYKIIK